MGALDRENIPARAQVHIHGLKRSIVNTNTHPQARQPFIGQVSGIGTIVTRVIHIQCICSSITVHIEPCIDLVYITSRRRCKAAHIDGIVACTGIDCHSGIYRLNVDSITARICPYRCRGTACDIGHIDRIIVRVTIDRNGTAIDCA